MLEYTPMSEEQIDKLGLSPKGQYRFRVIESENTISQKSGKPQLKLTFAYKDNEGERKTITGFLGTNGQFMLRMLRHFCRATNLMKEYDTKKINSDVVHGVEGLFELDIEEGGYVNDGSGKKYPTKNVIVDFIGEEQATDNATPTYDDDINF